MTQEVKVGISILLDNLNSDRAALEKNILGLLMETKQPQIGTALVLAALMDCSDTLAWRRVKCQHLKPENLFAIIRSCLKDESASYPVIEQLENVPVSSELAGVIRSAEEWQERRSVPKLPESVFMALLLPHIARDVVDSLIQFGFLDWESFSDNLSPDPQPLSLWDAVSGAIRQTELFDRSGKKVLNNLEAEARGLGATQYDVETLLVSLLEDKGSAICKAAWSRPDGTADLNQVVTDLRQRMRRPKGTRELGLIGIKNCHPRLVSIFEQAAILTAEGGRTLISSLDISATLLRQEKKSSFSKTLEFLGLNLGAMLDTVQCMAPEPQQVFSAVDKTPLAQQIKKKIVGQNHAIQRILPLIKRLQFGYRRPGKPAGVFLFLGPSGTGKTLMAKVLAQTVFGCKDNLLMLEMGQFGTRESKSMFIGAPPGYVGYGEGKLTNGLAEMPEGVILFDEVEKADPLVLDVLLRFLDEGRIDDPAGPVRDGSKCIIVLTSNFLADRLSDYEDQLQHTDSSVQDAAYVDLRKELLKIGRSAGTVGPDSDPFNSITRDRGVEKFFRPEFVFRIDEIILFRSLNQDDYYKIAGLEVEKEKEYLTENFDVALKVEDALLKHIAAESFKRRDEGARVVNRLVNVQVVNPLIDHLAKQRCNAVTLDFDGQTRQPRVVPK